MGFQFEMFTPQQKPWSRWLLTPRKEQNGSPSEPGTSNLGNGELVGKEKGIIAFESPPSSLKPEKYATLDKEALCEKLVKLERELFEYQYNMGLLLIEKKEWDSKYGDLRQSLAEANDAYKREQAAYLIAISEVEKREESLKKALGIEKQCVADLEKALHEMRSEHAEIKFTANAKLSEAKSLVTNIEEKSLEVEAKLHSVDAKLAEVSRKTSEIERKSQELIAQENALRHERSSFLAEREAHETMICKQREDLREWEQKLQEGEERLAESRRLLNQREQRANENDKIWKLKEKELEDAQKKIDDKKLALKKEEEEIGERLSSLASMEKGADDLRKSLESKERQLQELEEKLNEREKEEMQKLLDEHKNILSVKAREFELEMEQKRKLVDEEFNNKVADVQKKESELNHLEEKIRKREQALDKKSEKVKEKEKQIELKSKSIKEREKALKAEEKNLENERNQLIADKESLLGQKIELEKIRTDIESQEERIREERERLKLTEDERSEHARLQLELQQEIENCRLQRELLLKETEDLKLERLRFEKEWEELDERSAGIQKELMDIAEQKKYLEKLKHSEEERLKNEKLETQSYVQREMEALQVAKDSFTASMGYEKSVLDEKIESEKMKMLNDFEMQKRELETRVQRMQEEMDSGFLDRVKGFEENRDRELNNINYLREVAQREMEDMKLERLAVEKEKKEILTNKEQLETQQAGMQRDIDELVTLSRKLKDQREQFLKERERFIDFVEKQKSCIICAESIRGFVLSDLQLESVDATLLPGAAGNHVETVQGTPEGTKSEFSPIIGKLGTPPSGGTITFLRKCATRIFGLSPKKSEHDDAQDLNIDESLQVQSAGNEPELSLGLGDDSFDTRRSQSESQMREAEVGQEHSVDEQGSQQSDAKATHKRVRPRASRNLSIRAVVGDAKSFLGKDLVVDESQFANGSAAETPGHCNEENIGEPRNLPVNKRKRNKVTSQTTASAQDGEDSEHSESMVGQRQRKRRQKLVQQVQTPGEKRYNLRPLKTAAAVVANGKNLHDHTKGKKREIAGRKSSAEETNLRAAPNNVDIDGGASREEIEDPNAAFDPSIVAAKGDDSEVKSFELAPEFSAGASQFNDAVGTQYGDDDPINHVISDLGVSEEVNKTPERAREVSNIENRSDSQEEDDDDDVEHPGEVSMGRKLWTFLTT